MLRLRAALLVLAAVLPPALARAQDARLDRWATDIAVAADLTSVETTTTDWTLLSRDGIDRHSRASQTFWPGAATVSVAEAWVEAPDGSRTSVPPAAIFTRPSEAAQDAPGFTSSETTTIVFPQLVPGSRTHVVWRIVRRTPPLTGFNIWLQPDFDATARLVTLDITAPAAVPIVWRQRGGFAVADWTDADGTRRIAARMEHVPARQTERNSVAGSDYRPLFLATTQPSLEAYGALYHRLAAGRDRVTPTIAALAARVAGGRTGLDAARALYGWVTANIRYVAVYMDPDDGLVPHAADAVLAAGYGDCKDHVVLLQALLAARGIRAEAAIVDWGTRYQPLPLWLPQQFNHVIAWLPDLHVFLNPTSPYASFGALDQQLSDKVVVLATEAGAVARTPPARPEDYAYRKSSVVTLDAAGDMSGVSHITMAPALASSYGRGVIAGARSLSALVEENLSYTPEGGFGSLSASDPHDLDRPFALDARWRSPRAVAAQDGSIITPVPVGYDMEQPLSLRRILSATGDRDSPVIVGARDYTWDTLLLLPPGVAPERLPADVDFHDAAGSYQAGYARTADGVSVQRRLVVAHDVFAPEDYGAVERLLARAVDDARAMLVLTGGKAVVVGAR